MSYLIENRFHSQDLLSVLTSWNTQYDQHDILLICNLGHRVTTSQSFLSLQSPLIRTLLDNIPPFVDIPAISVSADVVAVKGLICLLTTGNTSYEYGVKLEEVEKAAESLGITLANCEIIVDNTSRRTPVAGFISPIMSVVKNIVMNTLSLEDTVDQNCASTTMPSLKKGRIIIATSIFKTNVVREKSVFPVSRKIDRTIWKLKKKSEIKEIDPNMPTINGRYVCQICDRSFAVSTSLSRHCKMKHLDITELRCECQMCNKSFTDKYVLKRHVNDKHCGDYKGLRCNNCGKQFHNSSALKIHSSIHLKPYKCVICETRFALESNMKTHLNIYHPGEVPLSDGDEKSGNETYASYDNSGDNLKITEVRSLVMEEVPNLACE